MSNGDIDYSKFTFRELEEAIAGINRLRYPQNYTNLCSEYQKRTDSMAAPPRPIPNVNADGEDKERDEGLWSQFWGSRPVLALAAVGFLWWAYDILSDRESCPTGGKLIGDLVNASCENFGQTAAAGIPLFIGLASLVLAIRSKPRDGA